MECKEEKIAGVTVRSVTPVALQIRYLRDWELVTAGNVTNKEVISYKAQLSCKFFPMLT